MSLIRAIRQGLSRVGRAPGLLLLVWAVNLVVALPFAALLAGSIHDSTAGRLANERLAAGYDPVWFGEYEAAASGFEKTFGPAVVGAGAFLRNLEAWWSGRLFDPASAGGGGVGWSLVATGVAYALLWALLLGGVIDHLAAGRSRLALGETLAAGGRFFWRFVRLAVLSGIAYGLVFLGARWGFGLLEEAAREVTVERTVFLWTLAGFAVVVLLLTLVRVVFDYAKIAVVLEDRRNVFGAARDGLAFVVRRPVRTVGLFWSLTGVGLLLLWLYGALAPTAGPATWAGVVLAFLLGQLALATRLGLRLAVLGGESVLFAVESGGPRPELGEQSRPRAREGRRVPGS